MIKNPFHPKNTFWYRIFKPIVDKVNSIDEDSKKESDLDISTDVSNVVTIKKDNAIVQMSENLIKVYTTDNNGSYVGIDINSLNGDKVITLYSKSSDSTLVSVDLDSAFISKLNDIVNEKYSAIMALN